MGNNQKRKWVRIIRNFIENNNTLAPHYHGFWKLTIKCWWIPHNRRTGVGGSLGGFPECDESGIKVDTPDHLLQFFDQALKFWTQIEDLFLENSSEMIIDETLRVEISFLPVPNRQLRRIQVVENKEEKTKQNRLLTN